VRGPLGGIGCVEELARSGESTASGSCMRRLRGRAPSQRWWLLIALVLLASASLLRTPSHGEGPHEQPPPRALAARVRAMAQQLRQVRASHTPHHRLLVSQRP
jgi:hypothetical protein